MELFSGSPKTLSGPDPDPSLVLSWWHCCCVTYYWLFFLVCPGPMTSQLRIEQNNKSSFLLFLSRVYNLRPLQVLLFLVNKNSPRSCLIINETFCSIHATYVLIYWNKKVVNISKFDCIISNWLQFCYAEYEYQTNYMPAN